jgi:hypothetical protein
VTVHIGHLHTDVVAAEPPGQRPADAPPPPVWVTDGRCLDAVERAAWLRARVSADGFDD